MKLIFTALLTLTTSAAMAQNCRSDAGRIADQAMQIFHIGAESEIHCMAVGGRTALISLPVTLQMPPRSAYLAKYYFPCGPQPREASVKLLLNQDCKIVNLEVKGFSL